MAKLWVSAIKDAMLVSTDSTYKKRWFLYQIKQGLVSAGSGCAWSTVASSDSTSVDASDLWVSVDNVIHGGYTASPMSWITLRSPTGSRGCYYMTLVCGENTNGNNGSIYITKEIPDIGHSRTWKRPPANGPEAGYTGSVMTITYSAVAFNAMNVTCADDGSFIAYMTVLHPGSRKSWLTCLFFYVLEDVKQIDPYGFVVGLWNTDPTVESPDISDMSGISPSGVPISCAVAGTYNGGVNGGSVYRVPVLNLDDTIRKKPSGSPCWAFSTTPGYVGVVGRFVDWPLAPNGYSDDMLGYRSDLSAVQKVGPFWVPLIGTHPRR